MKPLARDELLLVEPIDYGKTQSIYEHFSPSRGGFDSVMNQVPSPIILETVDYVRLNRTAHKGLRDRAASNKNAYPWKVPTISLKVVLGKH